MKQDKKTEIVLANLGCYSLSIGLFDKNLLRSGIILILFLSFFTIADSQKNHPPLTPAWAIEPWIWEDNGNNSGSLTELIYGYRYHKIPFGVVLIDSPWQTGYNTFDWDTLRYPEPEKLIKELHDQDIKVIIWLTAFFNRTANNVPEPEHPDYKWLKRKNYVVNEGKESRWWMGYGVHLDFTNPDAVEWWHSQLDKVIDMGIDGFKTDGGANNIGEEIITSKGIYSREDYRKLYYADVFDYLRSKNPEGIILARPYSHQGGYAASVSKCAVGWCGDFLGNWEGLQLQMDNIYRSATAGYAMLGCEIGGFVHRARSNKEQFMRYTQFAALLPVMINGGHNGGLTNHLPWFHGDEALESYRYYSTLHSELVPYIFSLGVDAHKTGTPIVRTPQIDQAQHMLGEELFVSPIVTEDTFKNVIFPDNSEWIDFWDEQSLYSPGSKRIYNAGPDKIPLFIRAGAIIPLNVKNSITGKGDGESSGKVTICIYPSKKSKVNYHLPVNEGIEHYNLSVSMDEQSGELSYECDADKQILFRIKSFSPPTHIEGSDSWSYDENNKLIIIQTDESSGTIKIDGLKGYSDI